TLGVAASDGQFVVATGVGAFAYESGLTARTSLGLANVENTALSTWAGTSSITTLGTITIGNVSAIEADPNVDTEAEIEAITGAFFGTSKAVTAGYLWIADGVDFESVAMSGDVTIASGGATVVGDDSHDHTATTISGLAVADFISPNISNWTNDSGNLTTVDISINTNLAVGSGITLTDDTLTTTAAGGLLQTTGGLTTTGVLEDFNTLGVAASDGQFVVATGVGAFAYESG
ncbi:MAG: hypothetical protein QQN44_07420, partial [Nitrosopumilus sp.]